jgi:hypothetical protein
MGRLKKSGRGAARAGKTKGRGLKGAAALVQSLKNGQQAHFDKE